MNPFRVAREINGICGEVENIEYHRSGSLLIVTKSVGENKTLSEKQIPIIVVPNWGHPGLEKVLISP